MMLSTNQNPSYFHQLFMTLIALLALLHLTACGSDDLMDPSPHQPPRTASSRPPVPQLRITSLKYDSMTNLITCRLQNQGSQLINDKLMLEIIPSQDTDATIQGTVLENKKHIIALDEEINIAGASCTKDFAVVWNTKLTSEFTFQISYATIKNITVPVGNPVIVSCNRPVCIFKDLAYNQSCGSVTGTIENQGKETLDHIVVHWQAETPGTQLMQSGNMVQAMSVGAVPGESCQNIDNLGQLHFGKHANAAFTFWLTHGSNPTHYSEQSVTFQLPILPVQMKLEAVGPTVLKTEANRIFKMKIQQGADSNTIYPALVQIQIKKAVVDSSKILYNSKEVTTLLGGDLADSWENISLEVDPGTEKTVLFAVHLTYAGQDQGEVKLAWYQDTAVAMFQAIAEKDLGALKRFLAQPDNLTKIDASDPLTGHTLLTQTIASLGDQGWEFVEVLLKHGAQVNILDANGVNPLHMAISHIPDDNAQVTKRLIGADSINIGIVTASGDTPLHLAADHGKEQTMKLLLDKLSMNIKDKPTILHQKNSAGKTALQLALEKNHANVAKQLAIAGAQADQLSPELQEKLRQILATKSY